MPALRVVRTIPVPARAESLSVHFRRDGRRALAFEHGGGRTWLLEADPDRREAALRPLPISIPPEQAETFLERGMASSAALDRVVVWTDRARVYALPSGETVAEIDHVPGRCLCLSPDGKWLIALAEERTWTLDLDASPPEWKETGVFHQREPEGWTPERDDEAHEAGEEPAREWIHLDHVDSALAIPWTEEPDRRPFPQATFWLLASCYGFVQSHLAVTSFTGWTVGRVLGETRAFGGLVYDPTWLLHPAGPRHALVLHGSGAGLTAVDPATGESFHCRVRESGHPYAFFRGTAVCGTEPLAWVRCRDGDFLWRIGQAPERMPQAPGRVLAMYPGLLLCATADGLAWVEAPESRSTADVEGVDPVPSNASPAAPGGPAREDGAAGWIGRLLRRLRG